MTSHGVPSHPPARGAFIISLGRSPRPRPRFVHFHCLFRTEYELICSFNTFCTCIHPYYVHKTYKTTYEFHFQLGFSRRSAGRDVTQSFPVARRYGEHSLYLSGVLRGGDPDSYVIYCHFCTEYELIYSFNTLCTGICPHYVQKTYKTTYEFIFSLDSPGEVQAETSHEVPSHPPAGGAFIISFGRSPRPRPRFVRDILSFLY